MKTREWNLSMYSAQSLVAATAFLTEHKFKLLERGVGGGRHDCDDQQNLFPSNIDKNVRKKTFLV